MSSKARCLRGAPHLNPSIKGYRVTRAPAKKLGFLVYTYKCSQCGKAFSCTLPTDGDPTQPPKCTHPMIRGVQELTLLQSYLHALRYNHIMLIKEGAQSVVSPKLVRFNGFIEELLNAARLMKGTPDPNGVALIVPKAGFVVHNLRYETDFINNWGGKGHLLSLLLNHIKDNP